MARKTIKMGKSTRRKLSTFADDFPLPKTSEGSSRVPAKPASVKTGEPSGGPLAKRGSTEVTRPGRPSVDVDGRQKRLPGYKTVPVGPEERISKPSLPAPEKAAKTPEAPKSRSGLGKLGATAALMGYSPAVGEGSDKPRNYPGEGLSPVGPPAPVKAAPTKAPTKAATATAPAAKTATANKPAPKPASSAPAAKSSAATPKPKAKPASASSKSSAEYDDWLADLRGSAARMKAETSRAAEKTGALKEKAGAFSQSFKKGGSVKSRGDGIAQRGRTKGRFV